MSISLQHIHLVAEKKYELAKWYIDKLDFKIIDDIEKLGEKDGPLFISGDGGKTALSIFNRRADLKEFKNTCLPAFCVSSENFLELYNKFSCHEKIEIIHHHLFVSFYILDFEGNKIEINCLDVKKIENVLKNNHISWEYQN
ncbi:MAG: hypothetical protein H6622_08635 [Halobacteriovoraceae bacterium]|nr:hypothetical protein [Halobacteriovoraceae bacterium]